MNTKLNHDRVDELFAQAVQLPPPLQDELLKEACGTDRALAAQVKLLLVAHERIQGDTDFLRELSDDRNDGGHDLSTGSHADDRTMPLGTNSDLHIRSAFSDLSSRFIIQCELGTGGFGSVYRATDELLQRDVAIKVPYLDGLSRDELFHFVEEARTLAQLKHSGIVSVYDVHMGESGRVSVIMEYLEGKSLHDRPRDAMSRHESVEIIIAVADAIQYAHEQGFVHRDLKPSNILFDHDGRPRVADFGLALHEDQQRTQAGNCSGTPLYMSPEQIRGEAHRLDGRTDIWSIGVILYELLCGRRPFSGETRTQIAEEILHRAPKPPRQIDRTIPVELEKVCLKCLSKHVADRFGAASELADRLRELQSTLLPLGGTTLKSGLPFRQIMTQANVGPLGCGLSVTLASLCVVALIGLRTATTLPEIVATPIPGKSIPDTDVTDVDIATKSVELPSWDAWPIRDVPFVPRSGGDPMTASNDPSVYWSKLSHVPTRVAPRYAAGAFAFWGKSHPELLGALALPIVAVCPSAAPIAHAQAACELKASAVLEPPWVELEIRRERELRALYLKRYHAQQLQQRSPTSRLTDGELNRQTGQITWPSSLMGKAYGEHRLQLEALFRERCQGRAGKDSSATIVRELNSFLKDLVLEKDAQRTDASLARRFLIGLKSEVTYEQQRVFEPSKLESQNK